MKLDQKHVEQAAFDWLKTKPWHCGMIGGYADLYHGPDEELKDFSRWFTKMMFDVIAFANTQEYEESPEKPCNCHDKVESDVVGHIPVDQRENGAS